MVNLTGSGYFSMADFVINNAEFSKLYYERGFYSYLVENAFYYKKMVNHLVVGMTGIQFSKRTVNPASNSEY
jgi:hypothetical protein